MNSNRIYDLRFRTPCCIILAGPTQCGKTTWTMKFLQGIKDMFTEVPEYIAIFYHAMQPTYEEMNKKGLVNEMVKGMPEPKHIELLKKFQHGKGSLVIIDDQQINLKSDALVQLFTASSHHYKISIILIVQNLFPKTIKFRDLSLQSQYIVVFYNPRDRTSVMHLSKQVFPGEPEFVKNAYNTISKMGAFSYILFDMHQVRDSVTVHRIYNTIHAYALHLFLENTRLPASSNSNSTRGSAYDYILITNTECLIQSQPGR